jgi:hypothetical protein
MANESRAGLILVALVAVGAAAFLYNKQLNLEAEKQRAAVQEQLHQRNVKCAEDGKKFAKEYLAEEASAVSPGHQTAWDDPEFHYSAELGTCLVRTRFVEMGVVTYQHARVTDVSSNKALLESYVKLSPDPTKTDGSVKEEAFDVLPGKPNLSRAEFQPRADTLMKR